MLTGAIIGALIVGGSCKAKGTMHYAKCTMVMPCSEQSKKHHAKCVMVTLNAHALVESRKYCASIMQVSCRFCANMHKEYCAR